MKNLYSEGVKNEEAYETYSHVPVESSYTVEDILAKYLLDFAIEEDTVLGYINDLNTFKEILDKMKDIGFAFSVRDSGARKKHRQKIEKEPLNDKISDSNTSKEFFDHLTVFYQLKAMPIRFFGLPFTIDKTTHYQCAYGCKYYKSRADELKPKKKRVGSKKMGCLAKMTIKHITVYPDYKLEVESDWRKKKKSSHNHPPIIIEPKLKTQKSKSHKTLIKNTTTQKSSKKDEEVILSSTVIKEPDWNYIEEPSSSLKTNEDSKDEQSAKTITLRDDNFLHTLVKFSHTTTTAVFEQVDYKPNEIKIEIAPFEPTENASTIEVYEYQPTIQELQTLFKEKLKNLYTLCNNCSNGSLILRLAGDLEQIEMQLNNDINYSNL
ncbi:hypothetical protein Phum_PHUM625810 [Pediculus humanus corporis]|uniref:FAR1 domain-containing protein n=1 Tax=Pediculus humanus subsp. corporis TaxID=121224 RepID=E0VND6_PEDHC|nr:uncharacterized protein Phum_PHUM625810 [Pediculus humanus corporis]EEB14892.1 hypothetical protein Phum_PHUM625810 [Pediculus humanus corporis]